MERELWPSEQDRERDRPELDPVLGDGEYPSAVELDRVRGWPLDGWDGLLSYVELRWRYAESGCWTWRGEHCLLSTAGWSGNESLIQALSENVMFWSVCWVWSRRGGHYAFRLPSGPVTGSGDGADAGGEAGLTDSVLLEQLERDYARPEIPPCRICGGPLAIGAIGGGEPTRYYCAAMSDAPRNGLDMDWNHYGDSLWQDRRFGGDARVLDLANRYRAALECLPFGSLPEASR